MKKFDNFWNDLLIDLKSPKKIKNWTVKKGYFGDDFTAQTTINNVILCTTLKGSKPTARRKDFKLIYNDWEGYLSERVSREMWNESFVTKYTISIIHQFLK